MKKFIIPLLTVAVVAALLLGCVPAPPVTPPPVTPPPVTPPPVTPPPVTPAVGCTPPVRTPPGGAASWVGTWDPETYIFEPVRTGTATGVPTAEPEGIWDGFAVKPDGTPYHFVWQICCMGMPWCASSYGVAKSYFERAGAEVTMLDSDLSIDAELAGLDDAVVKGGVDAFMLLPIDTVSLIPKIEEITDKGIPCFSWGVIIPGPALVASCARDYVALGEAAGRAFAEYAEERGEPITVYELWGMYGHLDAEQRHEGLHNILDEHPLVTVMESGECQFMAPLATDAIITTFSAHPEWDAIYDMGNMAAGVIEGLRTIDRLYPIGDPRHVFVSCQDGSPEAMKGLKDGVVDVVTPHSPWDETDVLIKAIFHNIILGQPVYRHYNNSIYPITPADADNPLVWGVAMNMGIPFDDYPILHMPEQIETPTLAMRMELCGY